MQQGDCKIKMDGVLYDGNEDDDVRSVGRLVKNPCHTHKLAPAVLWAKVTSAGGAHLGAPVRSCPGSLAPWLGATPARDAPPPVPARS